LIAPIGFMVLMIASHAYYALRPASERPADLKPLAIDMLLMIKALLPLLLIVAVNILIKPGPGTSIWGFVALGTLPLVLFFGIRRIPWGAIPFLWVWAALRSADYDESLRRIDSTPGLKTAPYDELFFKGTVLSLAGRQAEAEALLRDGLVKADGQNRGAQAMLLENLGDVLLRQGRYAEADAAYAGSTEILPDRGNAYGGRAEVLLRQGQDPQRALKLVDQAIGLKRATFLGRRIDRHVLGEMWANQAWALARLGRHAEADAALEQAFQDTDRRFKPGLAAINERAGHLLLLRGDRSGAIKRWLAAREIDPQGVAGRMAVRALSELGRR